MKLLLKFPMTKDASSNLFHVGTEHARMTRSRALLVLAMDRYTVLAYETTQLEIQKLAYFVQEAGEHLRLQYSAQLYGPYAENLNKVLQDMEGHLIHGFTGSRSPGKVIALEPGVTMEAAEYLKGDREAEERMERLSQLIEGYETPYGMELLASVHWVGTHGQPAALSADEAVTAVYRWSPRKAKRFPAEHIQQAWNRLTQQGWLGTAAQSA